MNDFKCELEEVKIEYRKKVEAEHKALLDAVEDRIMQFASEGRNYCYFTVRESEVKTIIPWLVYKAKEGTFAYKVFHKLISLGFQPKVRFSDGFEIHIKI